MGRSSISKKNIFYPHFSLLSFIIGLVTLSLVAFTGMIIGTHFKTQILTSQSTPFKSFPLISTENNSKTSQTFNDIAKTSCPKDGWLDCTTPLLRQSFKCSPEYLMRSEGVCPNIKGAKYTK